MNVELCTVGKSYWNLTLFWSASFYISCICGVNYWLVHNCTQRTFKKSFRMCSLRARQRKSAKLANDQFRNARILFFIYEDNNNTYYWAYACSVFWYFFTSVVGLLLFEVLYFLFFFVYLNMRWKLYQSWKHFSFVFIQSIQQFHEPLLWRNVFLVNKFTEQVGDQMIRLLYIIQNLNGGIYLDVLGNAINPLITKTVENKLTQ